MNDITKEITLLSEINSDRAELIEGEGLYLPSSKLMIGGSFHHTVNGKDLQIDKNIVVDEGLIYILNTSIGAVAQEASWFLGIFKNNYTPVAGDTAALFPGVGVADEASAEYDEGTRPSYAPNGTTSTVITNSIAPGAFTMNTTVNIYGAHLISNSVKAGTTGTLCAAAKFSAVRALVSLDVLNVTYQLTIADV